MPFPTPQRHNPGTDAPGGMPRHPDTSSSARGEAAEDDHAHVQPLLHPDLVHDADHLQRQHVLPQVVAALRAPGGGTTRARGGASGAGCPRFLGGAVPPFWAPDGGRAHLEDDPDIFPQGVDVLEGELQGDGVGVEIGAVLPPGKGSKTPSEPAGPRWVTAPPAPALTRGTIPFTSRLGLSGSRHDPLALKNCFTSSSPSRRMPCGGDTRGLRPCRTP